MEGVRSPYGTNPTGVDLTLISCPWNVRSSDCPAGSRTWRALTRQNPEARTGRVLGRGSGSCRCRARYFPVQFYMIARRCTQRQFLLRPDEPTNAAFTYCLIEAAQRCQIKVLLTCAMSNHHHTVISAKSTPVGRVRPQAAQRCQIEVLLTCAMSNHHHTDQR